ncbi:MAG: type II toxin-antitoxin system VapC family toxin [Boseongicola sp. SB0677_bin_26]|nr:type II toxin-antitoxin system VapC family toxin [Boseongicola sp. SB0665_bin_10]MYG27745.1 type II toxin-antitoxin system VapC family toxin [Boseongicola sp. SB0677_bin_26]
MGLLLDTHIWLWSLLDQDRLGDSARHALQSGETELFLSPVSVWEALLLAERGRVVLNPDPHRWLRKAMSISPVTEVPLTIDVAIAGRTVDIEHQDPADRFIAATAKVHSLTLVTADTRLLRCSDIDLLPGH